MKKSIKKIVACFLAVLMIVFSVPMSALAADVDHYAGLTYPSTVKNPYNDTGKKANYELIFNAWTWNNRYFDYTQDATSLNNRGIKDLPLEWNQDTHELWARKATADTAGFTTGNAASYRYKESGDRQLKAGDYFTMTMCLDNVKAVFSYDLGLEWSGVEGVTIYKWTYNDPDSGNDVSGFTFLSKDENTKLQAKAEELGLDYDSEVTYVNYNDPYLPIPDISAGNTTYFNEMSSMGVDGSTYYEGDKHFIMAGGSIADRGSEDIDVIKNKVRGTNSFKNPDTGERNYDWIYRCPLATYVFKVTDPENINFILHRQADGNGMVDEVCDFTTNFDQQSAKECYNYGRSFDVGLIGSTGEVVQDGHSFGINFNGKNIYADAQTTKTKVTFNNEDGSEISSVEGESGATYDIPSLASYTKAPDSKDHYTAAWKDAEGNAPTGTFGDADQTYTLTYVPEAHKFTSAVTKEATDTAAGETTYTCSDCGYSYVNTTTPPAKGHTYADPTFNWSDVVATNDAQSAKATATRSCVNGDDTQTADATVAVTNVTKATEAAAGSVTFTATATFDGQEYTDTKTEAIPQLSHTHVYGEPTFAWSDVVATNDAQSAKATASRACTAGDDTQTADATVAVTNVTKATEDAAGSVTFTATATFDGQTYTDTKTVEIAKLSHVHSYGPWTFTWADDASSATATRSCTAGDDTQTEDATVALTSSVDPTCTVAGSKTYTATLKDGTTDTKTVSVDALGHEYGPTTIKWNDDYTATASKSCVRGDDTQAVDVTVTKEHKDATKKEAGYDKYTATTADGVTDTKTVAIPALGVNVTIAATDLGNAAFTIDGNDEQTNGAAVTKAYKFGTNYTVKAIGSNFLGWEINGKLVSTSETFSSVAYTDVTLTPVFKDAKDGINVYFYDKYGNVFKSFEGVSAADYQAAVADAVPEAPVYPGYDFVGYDKSDDAIKANASNATFVAQYKKAETTYTVNAPDATIIADAGTVEGNTAKVPYDTKVTVKAEGAAGWAIDGKTVAYGDTYSFYVGSDVTVTPVSDATVAPTVAIINTTANAPRYTFLATRASGNATIVERGWIYGKNIDDSALADLDTAKATDGVRVKQAKVTQSEQFALTVKSSTAGTIKARAFITDSQGNVYYSDIASVVVE